LQVSHLLDSGDREVLSRHLVPLSKLIVEAEKQVSMHIGPVFIEDSIQVDLSLLEILALEHHRGHHNVHFFGHAL